MTGNAVRFAWQGPKCPPAWLKPYEGRSRRWYGLASKVGAFREGIYTDELLSGPWKLFSSVLYARTRR